MESDPGLQPIRAHVVSVLQELTAYQISPGFKTASEATAEALRQLRSALASFVTITENKGCGTSDGSTLGSSECDLGDGLGSMSEVPLILTKSATLMRIPPANSAPREDWACSLFLRKLWIRQPTPGPVLSGVKRPPDDGDVGPELQKVRLLLCSRVLVSSQWQYHPDACIRTAEGLLRCHQLCVTIVHKVPKQGPLLD